MYTYDYYEINEFGNFSSTVNLFKKNRFRDIFDYCNNNFNTI